MTDSQYNFYSKLFKIAAIYNLIWGALNIIFPKLLFDLISMDYPFYIPFWQAIGMFVMVYAPAYWWAGKYPKKYPHFIVIGFIGKLCGPIGLAWGAIEGTLPISFGWTVIFNDAIWLIPFATYLKLSIKNAGGLSNFIKGETEVI